MKRTLIAAAAVVAAVATAPAASADEYSYIDALENSWVSVFTGPKSEFVEAGYRACRQVGQGYSVYETATFLVRTADFDYTAAGEVVAQALNHLC